MPCWKLEIPNSFRGILLAGGCDVYQRPIKFANKIITRRPIHRKHKHALRVIPEAIFWLLRIGGQWRNLPEGFPNGQLVYYYFSRWKAEGTLEKLNFLLNQRERKREGKEASPSLLCIDSQSVKVAPFVS
jgi:transposase